MAAEAKKEIAPSPWHWGEDCANMIAIRDANDEIVCEICSDDNDIAGREREIAERIVKAVNLWT